MTPRESLDKARKAAPKADHIHYALAALDCLTGEADSALANLKVAIQLRPENRYHARNDEDFAFLQEEPRASPNCSTRRKTDSPASCFVGQASACPVFFPLRSQRSLCPLC